MPKTRAKKRVGNKRICKCWIYIFILIAVILIIWAITNIPVDINKDQLVLKCMQSFNQCKDTNLQQNGISLVLLDKNKFSSESKATEFFDKWKASLLQENFKDEAKNASYPLVLLASSIEKGDVKINFVIACESSGQIVDWMEKQLGC